MAFNNDNNNECCKCTTPECELILNEQGPQGRQGEKGDAGFTPIISVKDNTPSNYTLNILTQDGQITTPNLKANLPAGGATGQVLTKNSGEQDDCSWQNLPASTIETEGIARLATEADFETTKDTEASDNTIVTPALFNSELKKQSANFVTTNTNQDITGYKTFKRQTQFHGSVVVRPEDGTATSPARVVLDTDISNQPFIQLCSSSNGYSGIGLYNDTIMYIQAPFESDRIVINNYKGEGAPTGNAKDVVIYGNLINKNNNIASRVLNQDNVTAGNNITIDKTSTGITINSTGGGVTDAYTKTETDNLLDAKQDKLVATTGIEIDNNNIGINQKGTSLIEYNNTNRETGYIEDDVLHQEQNVIDYIEGIATPIIDIPDNVIHSFDISTVVKLSDYDNIEDNRIIEIGGVGTNAAFFDTHAYNIKNMVRMGYSINKTINTYWHETIQDDKYLAVRMTNDGTTLKFFTKVVDTPELPTEWNEWENIPWDLSLYPIEKGDLPAIINIGGEVTKNPANNIISTINIQKGLYYLTQTKIIINNTLFSYTSSNYNDAMATTENYGLVKIDGDSLTINENYQLQANIPTDVTRQGNTFNGANQLVQLDGDGKLPAVDGSQLINLPGGNAFPSSVELTTPNFNNVITEGLYYWGGYTTPQNHPDGNSNGYLMVLSLAGGFTVKQIFFEANGSTASEANTSNKMYMRVCISNKSTGYDWSNWVQLVSTSNISTLVPTGSLKYWTGTEANYTAIETKDADTLYRTTDTNKVFLGTIQLGG